MTRALRALIFLIPIVAWAQPAGAPEPTVDDVIQELIRRSAAQNHGRQTAAARPTPAPPAAIAAPPPAPPAPPPSPVVVTAPTQVDIPQDVRNAIVSLCSLLITGGLAAGLTWMRSHFAFMQQAAANQAVTSSANDFGALLEQALAKQGKSLSTVSISDPNVAAFAQKLIAAYPEWGPLIGLTPDVAERKVLAGAIQQSSTPIIPVAPVTTTNPTNPTNPTNVAAPAPTVSVTPSTAGATIVTAEVAPTVVPTPPMDLEVKPP